MIDLLQRHPYKSLTKYLVRLIKELQNAPFEKKEVCHTIQETLILNITKVERRIRKLKADEAALSKNLHNKESNNSKDHASVETNPKKITHYKIDQYQNLRIFLKSFGDTIVKAPLGLEPIPMHLAADVNGLLL